MKKIYPASSWNLPPTARQCSALFRYGAKHEEIPTTRWEARRLLYELRQKKETKQ